MMLRDIKQKRDNAVSMDDFNYRPGLDTYRNYSNTIGRFPDSMKITENKLGPLLLIPSFKIRTKDDLSGTIQELFEKWIVGVVGAEIGKQYSTKRLKLEGELECQVWYGD
ncbi:unnamed protein product [Hymenolepis diminuta]|uniref:Uncharacterized protein n=1 Tax=Hymenolepis diminuta TaxID=6216 RepID=A0A564Y3W6_HYMDI|nr:unnamed protein product [Hymenolepis diminuta]